MWTDTQFWKDATWRAFRSFCQCLAALLGGQTFTALNAPWYSMLSVSATAGLLSLLMSIDRGRAVTEAGPVHPVSSDTPVVAPVVAAEAPTAGVVALGDEHAVSVSCADLKG